MKSQCALCDSTLLSQDASGDLNTCHCSACGTYRISGSAIAMLRPPEVRSKRYVLQWATRAASEAGVPLVLSSERATAILAEPEERLDLPLTLDRLLLGIHESTLDLSTPVQVGASDYPKYRCRSIAELGHCLKQLASLGWVKAGPNVGFPWQARLAVAGWERVKELRSVRGEGTQAFVAMWFDRSMDDIWLRGLKPAIHDAGWVPHRIDQAEHNEKIDDKIVAEVRRSAILVADFTGHRGGVYFEAGLALGLGIPVIWTVRSDEIGGAHFDTRQYNYVVWETAEQLYERLKQRLQATLPGPLLRKQN